jgi:hypothetical protein
MGFTSNNTIVKGVLQKEVSPSISNTELTEKELEFLLITIKNSLFKGEYVEICYNVTLKLQEKYKELNKK